MIYFSQEEQKRRENRNLKASGVLVTMSLTFLLLQWTENFWVDYSVELYKKNLAAYNSSRYMGYIITATNAASNFLFYMCLPSMRQASVQFIKSLLPIWVVPYFLTLYNFTLSLILNNLLLGGGGGTIYSNWFFFVQTILAARFIHRTEMWVASLESSSSVKFKIK